MQIRMLQPEQMQPHPNQSADGRSTGTSKKKKKKERKQKHSWYFVREGKKKASQIERKIKIEK